MKLSIVFVFILIGIQGFGQDFSVYSVNDPEIGSFATGDFNDDSFTDIMAIDYQFSGTASVYLYSNKKESTISFAEKLLFDKIPFTGRPASGDLDGDGDIDLVYNNALDNMLGILMNDGAGNFTLASLGVPGGTNIMVTDLDKDGDPDLVSSRVNPKNLHVYINNGSLSYTATNIYNTTAAPTAFDVADFDNDSDLDILLGVSDRFNIQVFIYENTGNGNYSITGIPINGFNSLFNIYADDVNKDGKEDILVLTDSDVKILENKGALTFEEKQLSTGDARLFTGAHVVDLTGEGHPDIVLASLNGMEWYKSVSLSEYSYEKGIMNGVTGAYNIEALDLNNDGARDVITSNGSLWWYQNRITQLPSDSKDYINYKLLGFPNPVVNEIHFKDVVGDGYSVTLYNLSGQEVLKGLLSNGKVDISSLLPGVYTAMVLDSKGKKVGLQKFVKE